MTTAVPFVKQPLAWEFYYITQGGNLRAIIEFDREAALETDHAGYAFGFRAVFYCDEEACDDAGMPLGEEEQRLQILTDRLLNFLEEKKIDCKLVGRITLAAMREIVFQAAEYKNFWVLVTPWIADCGHDGELRKYEEWSFFDDYICPDEAMQQQIDDRNAVEKLIAAGHAPGAPIVLRFTFIGADAELDTLQSELGNDGFIEAMRSPGMRQLDRKVPLEGTEVFRLTLALVAFSHDMGLQYEGWRVDDIVS
jgi:Family of unknown function (DUF695)